MTPSRLLRPLGLALALSLAACGDDEPERAQTTVDHRLDALAAAPDAAADTASPPDTPEPTDSATPQDAAAPLDTATPADTTSPADATSPTDTAAPTDTVAPADTSPVGGPSLAGPALLGLPWVAAGAGATQGAATFSNLGPAGPITVTLTGAPGLTLVAPPTAAPAFGAVTVTVRWAGAASPTIVRGDLRLAWAGGALELPVWAVAGDPTIPAASWTPLTSASGQLYGHTAVLPFPTAPYPTPGGAWSDPSVLLFVPAGLRDRGATDFVVHFHGFGAVVDEVVASQGYREQLWLSGVNAVLVAPQGPYDASSGDFGKLMDPGGLEALLADVLGVLYRSGRVATPQAGDLLLTEHSGGYQAVAENLDAITAWGQVTHALLFDGLYARSTDYQAFAQTGGALRSNYTTSGGTKSLNLALAAALGAATQPTHAALRDAGAVIWFADTSHGDAMRFEQVYAEALRWGATRSRQGPRVELRSATRAGSQLSVRWSSPDDDDLLGFDVETATATGPWQTAASVGPDASTATFAASGSGGWRVRVAPRVAGVPNELALRSDAGFVGGGASVLVVDGFDRAYGGSYPVLRHELAARVGAALGAAATASNEAFTDGGDGAQALAGYDTVVWLLGDESTSDHTFTAAEQAAVTAYLAAGGSIVVSGSEVAWDLGAQAHGTAFLAGLGAKYGADDANSYSVSGAGPLAGVGPVGYGGAGAAYPEDFPDVVSAATGGTVVLRYANGQNAAAGIAGRAVVVGFPLELVDGDSALSALGAALVAFARGD